LCNRPGNQRGDGAQGYAAKTLDGPGGVEERRLVAALVLDDGRPDADVGEALKSLDENVDQGHDPEQLRPEQAGEDEVDPQPQGEGDSVTACGPKGSADGAGAEGFGFGDRRAGGARRGVRQRWGARGDRDGGRGDRGAPTSCSH